MHSVVKKLPLMKPEKLKEASKNAGKSIPWQRRTVEQRKNEAAAAAAAAAADQAHTPTGARKVGVKGVDSSMSLRDIVEHYAQENDLQFMPNRSLGSHEGKQIYYFGPLSIYLDVNAVYAKRKNATHWKPCNINELVSMAKKS